MCRRLFFALLLCFVWRCAAASTPVRVGVAWQPSQASYSRPVVTLEAAGAEVVLLPQVFATGVAYTAEGLVDPAQLDTNGVLLQNVADRVKASTYSGAGLDTLLRDVDAVVFLGGGDVCPTLFRTPESWCGLPDEKNFNATRDLSEYLTMAYCLDHDIPVLGLCRGMQLLGVVSGASLVQDLGLYYNWLGTEYRHLHREPKDANGQRNNYMAHDVALTGRGTLLRGILDADTLRAAPSWHHQAVGDISGTPLRISATTCDRGVYVIEAIERTDKAFALGVQFHPEVAVAKRIKNEPDAERFTDLDTSLAFFKALVKQAVLHREKVRHNK